jgi:hypothetical protein
MMSARHEHVVLEARPRPTAIEVFEARCWARAELFAIGEYDLHEAVDVLQEAAVASGLVAKIGQDQVQEMIAEAFAKVRADEVAIEPDFVCAHKIEPLPDVRPLRTATSTLEAAAWLAFQVKDAERWRAWLDRHSATECADIVEHLTNIKQRRRAAA